MLEATEQRQSFPADEAVIRTFLIADVRGYTRFTLEHGDAAAVDLTRQFAGLAEDVFPAYQGRIIEVRGDEVLVMFVSARQALRAALAFQQRCAAETSAERPLRVGIGLDAGEAIPVENAFRGTALNLAARLCSLAGPGEVLASEAVSHLASTLEGIAYS